MKNKVSNILCTNHGIMNPYLSFLVFTNVIGDDNEEV